MINRETNDTPNYNYCGVRLYLVENTDTELTFQVKLPNDNCVPTLYLIASIKEDSVSITNDFNMGGNQRNYFISALMTRDAVLGYKESYRKEDYYSTLYDRSILQTLLNEAKKSLNKKLFRGKIRKHIIELEDSIKDINFDILLKTNSDLQDAMKEVEDYTKNVEGV